MPNFLKAALSLTLCLVSGQYADTAIKASAGDAYEAVVPLAPQADQVVADYKEELPALGEMVNPLIGAGGADLIDAFNRGSAALQETLIDLQAERDTSLLAATEANTTQYKYIDTERRHIFMWTGIFLTITTYMGVMAFFNMPLKKDPLLYTKLYSGAH